MDRTKEQCIKEVEQGRIMGMMLKHTDVDGAEVYCKSVDVGVHIGEPRQGIKPNCVLKGSGQVVTVRQVLAAEQLTMERGKAGTVTKDVVRAEELMRGQAKGGWNEDEENELDARSAVEKLNDWSKGIDKEIEARGQLTILDHMEGWRNACDAVLQVWEARGGSKFHEVGVSKEMGAEGIRIDLQDACGSMQMQEDQLCSGSKNVGRQWERVMREVEALQSKGEADLGDVLVRLWQFIGLHEGAWSAVCEREAIIAELDEAEKQLNLSM